MKRPLVRVALLYAGGLLLGNAWQPPLLFLFCAAFAIAAGAIALGRLRFFLIWPLIVLVGWTNLVFQTIVLSPQDVRNQLGPGFEDVVVRGRLTATPESRIHVRDEEESWRTLAKLEVTAVKRGTDWHAASGKIIVSTRGVFPTNFFGGQQVEIAGIIAPPPVPLAPGLFDYRTYLQRQGIAFQLKADSPANWNLLSTNQARPMSDRFIAWGQATLARGLPEVDEPLRLLWYMTLGWRMNVQNEVYEPFMKSGTMHIFAISGLHIALIAAILVALLRVVQIPRLWCGVLIIPLIWFYTAVTGWQPSAVRATLMASIVIGGWSLKRPSDLVNSLAAAGLIILICDPQQLFQASFQLSFSVVLSIALLMPPLEKFRDRLLQIDPLLPAELLPRWQRYRNWTVRKVLTMLATSVAAWLGSWPLVAYYFHIFSPVTLLANLLIVPLSGFALACNLGSLICGNWFPFATDLFNNSAWWWMKCVMWLSTFFSNLPHAFSYVAAPTAADFAIYYGALLAVLTGVALKRRWRWLMIVAVVGIVGFYTWRWEIARNTTTLSVLPLSGGSTVYVEPGHRANNLLVDCGDTNSVEFVTEPFLHSRGVDHLPRLALTQGDIRDVGGALAVCDSFSVDQVFTSGIRFRSTVYRQIVDTLDNTTNRHVIVNRSDAIGAWRVLHPASTNRFTQADDNSLVLQGEFHGVRVLLLSDLGYRGQNALLESTNDLRADIVVTGLPEQSEPVSDALLDVVRPQLIIVMDSQFPATKRASADLRERLERRKISVLYTSDTGAINISLHNGRWRALPMVGPEISGEYPEK